MNIMDPANLVSVRIRAILDVDARMEDDYDRMCDLYDCPVIYNGEPTIIGCLQDVHYEVTDGDSVDHVDDECQISISTLFLLLRYAGEQYADCGFCEESSIMEACLYSDAIEEAETLRELFMALESAVVRVEDSRKKIGSTV